MTRSGTRPRRVRFATGARVAHVLPVRLAVFAVMIAGLPGSSRGGLVEASSASISRRRLPDTAIVLMGVFIAVMQRIPGLSEASHISSNALYGHWGSCNSISTSSCQRDSMYYYHCCKSGQRGCGDKKCADCDAGYYFNLAEEKLKCTSTSCRREFYSTSSYSGRHRSDNYCALCPKGFYAPAKSGSCSACPEWRCPRGAVKTPQAERVAPEPPARIGRAVYSRGGRPILHSRGPRKEGQSSRSSCHS